MLHMTNTAPAAAQPRFAIIRRSGNGRTWYQAREVGTITTLVRNLWSTTDRAAADRLADEVGGHVVTLAAARGGK